MFDIRKSPPTTAGKTPRQPETGRRGARVSGGHPAPCPTYTLRPVAPGWAEGAVQTYVVQDEMGEVVGMMQIARRLATREFCVGVRRALKLVAEARRPSLTLVVVSSETPDGPVRRA